MAAIKKKDFLIAGVGGQGTLLTGKIIAAAAQLEGYDTKTSETHGMAQRGGSVVIHVRADRKVYAPLVPPGEADYLIAFEKLEALRFLPWLSPQGTVIVNRQVINPLPVLTGKESYPRGIAEALEAHARRVIPVNSRELDPVRRHPRTANLLLLGILARQLDFPRESWLRAAEGLIPPRHLQVNRLAFDAGWEYQK